MASSSRKKADEKAALKSVRKITITLEADEMTLQRLAALLLFSSRPYEVEEAPANGPMPWEDPNDPRFIPEAPALQINHEQVRRDIVSLLTPFVQRFSKDAALELIKQHGGATLASVPTDSLLPLWHDLNDRLNPETPA